MQFIFDHQDLIFNVLATLGIPVFIANAVTMFLNRNCLTKWGAFLIKILDTIAMNIKNNANKQEVVVAPKDDYKQPVIKGNVVNDPRSYDTVVREHDGA